MDKRLVMMAKYMDERKENEDMRMRMPIYPVDTWSEPYARHMDYRGREHYENGRYAPMSIYETSEPMRPMNRIGFNGGDEVRTNYSSPVRNAYDETAPTQRTAGHAESNVSTMNYATAEKWLEAMRNDDGTVGPHWSFDQVKGVMHQKDIDCDPVAFWVAMNMMYSDYSKVAKAMNVNTVDFYAKMAKAFLDDKDAAESKLENYYRYIVR